MIEAHYYILVASAGILTLGWLYLQQNVAFTTIMASGLWFIAAYEGGDLTRVTSCCEIATSAPELQYISLALALVSLLARLLYSFGEYPPNEHVAEGSASAAAPDS